MDESQPVDAPEAGPVRRRKVIYVPGYDPFNARRYRELYRSESREQAALSGYSITISARDKPEHYGWHVAADMEGAQVESEVVLLAWSDIVKESMERGLWQTYLQMLRTMRVYACSGAFRGILQLNKGPVIGAFYPVVFLVLQLLFALAVAFGLGWGIAQIAPWWLGLAGLAVVAPILRWFARHDNLILARYLLHTFAFSCESGGAYPPALEARIATFERVVAEALEADVDEVLVVGHSLGAHVAISMLSDLIRAGKHRPHGPVLSLLTLGHVIPMVSLLPGAARLRADLNFLSACEALCWIDVTAPGDGCTFALTDPAAISGVAPENQRWPLILSAAFSQTLSPERWKALRWRFYRLHFQYLCAFDRPNDYDYFRITAGSQTLCQRLGHRKPSPGVKRRCVSKQTSMELRDV
ncbi:hypothetical protein [Aliiruegeria lutimaris]|uniref:Alpha/beta hydrolase family protein n=1 Tax=Aliiruegeria lutimaris TaxID=571298 RepID=A0A1G9B2W5_9RHOB|nr:hypothetical protein [Aliiruegeria lutimaris]SDK33909.1 hypothetical protein SAMN04488026_103815 [Aliiruegeria lutimaris]